MKKHPESSQLELEVNPVHVETLSGDPLLQRLIELRMSGYIVTNLKYVTNSQAELRWREDLRLECFEPS